MDGKCPNL